MKIGDRCVYPGAVHKHPEEAFDSKKPNVLEWNNGLTVRLWLIGQALSGIDDEISAAQAAYQAELRADAVLKLLEEEAADAEPKVR